MRPDIPLRPDEDLVLDESFEICFEDEHMLVVSKGAPLPVHPVSRFLERNLLSLLEKKFGQKLFLANRLDSETSGLILVAKSDVMAGRLGEALQSKKVRKEYQAVVMGIPQEKQGFIRGAIKGRRDQFCHIYEIHPEGKESETEYEVIETRGKLSLLKLIAHTGRTHQLRVHLKSIGCPIAGDKIYIDLKIYDHYVHHGWQPWMAETAGLERLALHAARLELEHPVTKEKLILNAPFPARLEEFFKQGS